MTQQGESLHKGKEGLSELSHILQRLTHELEEVTLAAGQGAETAWAPLLQDRKSTRLNSSHRL